MKLKEFQKILDMQKIDFALFLNSDENKRDKSIYYLSGVDPEFCCLVVPKKKPSFLVVAKLEEELVKKRSEIRKVVVFEKKLFEQIKKRVGDVQTIGVNFSKFSLAEKKLLQKTFKKIKIVDISKEITELRIQKTKEEIKKTKKACSITDNIFSKIVTKFNFKKESEIADFIESEAKKNSCTLAFPTIVASGKNASMPHYNKNSSNLQKGFCVIDFGVKRDGYSSDMTRTIFIGRPSHKEMDHYNKVLSVQKEAINQIKPGVDYKKIDESARKVLGKEFIHGLGHGLGIDIHEPISTDMKKMILKENTILTIEPGIYYKNKFGIRIEDDVLVTKKGCEVLTKSRKDLVVVKR